SQASRHCYASTTPIVSIECGGRGPILQCGSERFRRPPIVRRGRRGLRLAYVQTMVRSGAPRSILVAAAGNASSVSAMLLPPRGSKMSESMPIQRPTGLTSGDFTEAEEPFQLFAAWFEQATRSEPRDSTAMSLATVDTEGLPNVRMVLMKSFGEAGFVFYTNIESQKGQELDRDHKGALLFHWKSLNRQVRLPGPREVVQKAE